MPVFNPLEKMQKCGQQLEYMREKWLPVLVNPCMSVLQSDEAGGDSGSNMATS